MGNYGIIIPIGPPAPLFDVSHGGTFFMPDPIKNPTTYEQQLAKLRNICAHYGRLYYRNFPSVPAGFKTEGKDRYRLWTIMQSVKELYYDAEKWNTSILKPMVNLFKEYKDDINLAHIAFPLNWVDLLTKK